MDPQLALVACGSQDLRLQGVELERLDRATVLGCVCYLGIGPSRYELLGVPQVE